MVKYKPPIRKTLKEHEKAIVKRINHSLTGIRVRNQKFFVALLWEIYRVTDPELFRPRKDVEQ